MSRKLAFIQNMVKKAGELLKDNYRVRWPLVVKGLCEIKEAGQIIKVSEIVPSMTIKIEDQNVLVNGLVRTDNGLIPISYLEPKQRGNHFTSFEQEIFKNNPISPEVGSGIWWMGRRTAIEAGIYLQINPSFTMGTYVVCQPPEMEPTKPRQWAEFVLAVRSISGSVEQWVYEWELNNRYNHQFGEKFGKRSNINDILPSTCPLPSVNYFIIKRNQQGLFSLDMNYVFMSIDLLLEHYYHNALPIKTIDSTSQNIHLCLTSPGPFSSKAYSSPRPLLGPMNSINYKSYPIQLFLAGIPKPLTDYHPRFCRSHLFEDINKKEILYRAYLFYNGRYNSVAIRKLNSKLFCQKSFDNDIKKITDAESAQFSASSTVLPNSRKAVASGLLLSGYNYLSHIVSYGRDNNPKFASWIAFEFIMGTPLDLCLQKRKYFNEYYSPRHKYEIMYQISAGMRFLELNNLCHRHLRASNVIVQHETMHMYSIKITDYMIPYHFLDKENVSHVNMTELDWPWWAPESILHKKFDIVSDIWAFGCVMFEIMHDGLAPYTFQKKRPESYYDLQEMHGRGETMVIIKENDQSTFMDNIVLRCLNHDPKARPTFDHLYNFFRELLFDFTLGAESAIKKYFSEVSDTIEHKYEGSIKKVTDN